MPLGYDKKIYIMAFDHRGSFIRLFGLSGSLTPEDTARVADAKMLIFEGLQRAVAEGAPRGYAGVLRRAQHAVALHRLDVGIASAPDETARCDRAHERAGQGPASAGEQCGVRQRDRIGLRAESMVRVDRLAPDHHREQRDPGCAARAGDSDVQHRSRGLGGEGAASREGGSDRAEAAGERAHARELPELPVRGCDEQDHPRRIGGSRLALRMRQRPSHHPRGTPDE